MFHPQRSRTSIMTVLALALTLTLTLAACASDGSTPPPPASPVPQSSSDAFTSTYYQRVSAANEVFEFTLSDGTRCAVLDGPRSGGITCDWASSPTSEPLS